MKKKHTVEVPDDMTGLLLHACCAPCSTAILEWLLQHNIEPVIYYYNPNIVPLREYEIRKDESKRQAEMLGLKWIDDDNYDHLAWRNYVKGLENEPERGLRCLQCFKYRLHAAAKTAKNLGLSHIATTLASSRWKSLLQVSEAGKWAVEHVDGVEFWDQNWRICGLQDRRSELIKQYGFYNQLYCGCEFSFRVKEITTNE